MEHNNVGKVDKNLSATGTIQCENLQFYNVKEPPFAVYGLLPCSQGEPFRRIPSELAKQVNNGVWRLYKNTSGGRVRFRTDSDKIAIRAFMPDKCLMPHMPFIGSSGFDLYEAEEGANPFSKGTEADVTWHYRGSFMPPINREGYYEALVRLDACKERDLMIHFPLYDNVDELWIGLEKNATLQEGGQYRNLDPVIYYGSSITQGGCASRPGNAYPAIISRQLNCDFRNLGFSGSGRGEQISAQYIAEQPMCVFVMDYDHNAPTPMHLAETHEPFFLTIREKRPDLPIVLVSRTDTPRTPQVEKNILQRWETVRRTYENALKRGDKLVYLVDGRTIFPCASALGINADSCTVDGMHPNDLGFACMAKVIGEKVKQAISH